MRCGRSLFCRSDYWSEVRRFTLLKNEAVTAGRLVRGCQLTGSRVGRNRRSLIVSAANGKYPSRFSGLSDVHARNGPCNDQALYFRSPFKNRVDLRVPVPALDRIFTDVAVAAQDLDGLFGHLDGRFAGVELGHRALAIEERLTRRGHP
jgi:hypothetical protein